ncbi:limonene-1,2-epoxide hydrolase [Polymorphobacter fuscus]|uniref:Limonene-1,2-epoxide hydrolase n=2 Tax=Sandarakinorhabdus fusca TaxID=1439888 RepID=A0A7C9KLJ5_9SPHN|nr:limonene-1,2-epoxide hydrolase family protein [Polymorphobacter fuscus]KAB7648035.1 limonene-1,2-epoxide hydrolase [Polymorphobacter fuscus]MQT17183.1 limonene-1,2-epoxide hydrolase [Polymorphobacter fuscus]
MESPVTPLAIVTDFCAAWDRLDWDAIHAHLAENLLYHNVPMAPVAGLAAFKAFYAAFPVTEAAFEIHHIAANGPVVMTERTDRFRLGETTIVIRVMGVFEIGNGKIAVWRDYFDLAEFSRQMPTELA